MKTAVEWFIINLIQVCGAPPEGTWKEVENLLQQAKEMEKEKSYNLDDLRNAYRWGITATIGTSDHFEEFVNNIKSE